MIDRAPILIAVLAVTSVLRAEGPAAPTVPVPRVGVVSESDRPGLDMDRRMSRRARFDEMREGPFVVQEDGALSGPLGGLEVDPECLPDFDEVLLVNGIQTDSETALREALGTGDQLGVGVRLAYNAELCPIADYVLAAWDKLTSAEWGGNQSTWTIVHSIREAVGTGHDVRLIGYSEGAICINNAVRAYAAELRRDPSLIDAERRARLHAIHILTVGGAAFDEDHLLGDGWPADLGSLYHVCHQNDFIANLFGPGQATNWPTSLFTHHDYLGTYLPHLQPWMLLESGTLVVE